MWHFQNNEIIFDWRKSFRPKSTFNPKSKNVIIETYLSTLKENLLGIDTPKDKLQNLSKKRKQCLVLFRK